MKGFMQSLPIIAKAIGRQYGVKVVIGGDQACTDGKTIYLPNLPPENDSLETLLNGYLDHEAAHCRFTDFGVDRAAGQPLQLWLENALEDIRIETLMGQVYPGCKKNLAALTTRLVDDGETMAVDENTPATQVLTSYILHGLRYSVLKQTALEPMVTAASGRIRQVFPSAMVDQLDPVLDEVRQARSTQDVIDLAERVMAILRDELDPPEQPEQPEQRDESKDSDDSSDGDSGEQPDSDEDDTESESNQSQSDSQDSDSSEDGDEGTGNDQGADESSDAGEDEAQGQGKGSDGSETDADKRKAIQAALDAAEDELPEDAIDKVCRELEAEANKDPESASAMSEVGGEGQAQDTTLEFVNEQAARQASARLRSRLAGLLQAQQLEYDRPARSGRRINRAALPHLRMGNPRVFRQQIEADAVNTAVTVLLDRSGSMAGSRLEVAREAALALTFSLEETEGVNASTFAFPGVYGRPNEVEVLHRRNQRVNAKAFGISANGGTPLARAAWFAGWDLLQAQEPRKILLVITDGQPHDGVVCVDVLERLRRDGIETLGVGIQTTIPVQLFPENEVIKDVSELSNSLFRLMEKKLVMAA